MKIRFILFLTLSLLCIRAGAAQDWGTPDGMPPSMETVCDMEQGAAYGHCNAYCEAMDCELANDNDPNTNPNASANACSKVRTKYQQATGHDVPCEVTCPCNAPAFPLFYGYTSGQTAVNVCAHSFLGNTGILVGDFGGPRAVAIQSPSGQWLCGSFQTGLIPITPEQGLFCAELLEQARARDGVTCFN